MSTSIDVFEAPTKIKANGNGHRIACRIISIEEGNLLKMLGIHNAAGAAYSAYRRLAKTTPELTPADIARAVREVRPMAELWIDEVAARLDRLQPYTLRRPVYRRRSRRLAWPRQRSSLKPPRIVVHSR